MDIIAFGEDWGGHPSSTQHIFTQLMERGHRVIWVNSIGLRRPRLNLYDLGRIVAKVGDAFGKVKDRPKGDLPVERGIQPLEVVAPVVLPFPGSAIAGKINELLLGRLVRSAIKRYNFKNTVLWATLPTALYAVKATEYKAVVYYCCDDFGSLEGVDPEVVDLEERLGRVVDKVIAVNQVLAGKFPRGDVVIVPHGVDFDLFTAQTIPPDAMPSGKVAGFYGSISEWLDQALLREVVGMLPDWRFVFVGDVRTAVDVLSSHDRVSFLGPRPHSELPRFSQHWDVSLLPFVDNGQIRACNPLKLREYLAAGKPVVSTDFPAVRDYEEHVSIVAPGDARAFANAIEASSQGGISSPEMRRGAVQDESWKARAEEIERIIQGLESC